MVMMYTVIALIKELLYSRVTNYISSMIILLYVDLDGLITVLYHTGSTLDASFTASVFGTRDGLAHYRVL